MPCDARLRKHELITERLQYKEVINKGRVATARRLKAYILIEAKAARKAGFIAGRSAGGACERNRAKRLLKEAYRRLKSETSPAGFQVVFIAGPGMKGACEEEVRKEMRALLEASGVLPPSGEKGRSQI